MIKYFLFALFVILFIMSCDDDNDVMDIGTDPIIEQVKLKSKWNLNSDSDYKVEAYVKDPQGSASLAHVFLNVTTNDTANIVFQDTLYDDGAYYNKEDGDVLAKDGVFSNKFKIAEINPSLIPVQLSYRFQAVDNAGHFSTEIIKLVEFSANAAPVISAVQVADSFKSGESEVVFRLVCTDADGTDDLEHAYFDLQKSGFPAILATFPMYNDGNTSVNGDSFAGDSVFSAKFDSSFNAGRKGLYKLSFYVQDTFDEINQDETEHLIYLQNNPGTILDTYVPDTLYRPTDSDEDTLKALILSATVTDPQSLADVDSVYFLSQKPDGSLSGDGFRFELKDNGDEQFGDQNAGDGTYSIIIIINKSANPGIYKFYFNMRDKVGHLADVKTDSVLVL